MSTIIVAVLSFAGFILAYYTYGRWLGRKIFGLDKKAKTPSHKLNDGTDFVPTRMGVLFGHHFTSIAGTGPIVGPAIAVFWGWLPALLWVVFGSIFIGAVHDFGALVISMRHEGRSVGDIAKDIISSRAQLLLLILLMLILTLVLAVFGLVIALIFSLFPESVLPVWISLPLAICVGLWVYKRKGSLFIPSMLALATIYFCVWLGTLYPVDFSHIFKIPLLSGSYANVVVVWTVILFIYCFIASVLPVWVLLQPRDFINANQLFVALGISFVGVFAASIFGGADLIASAPAVAKDIPVDAPPIMPFLFITVACGAVSGFHSLVSSGTSSKQIANEHDAAPIGYGGMLLEGSLAVIVLLACTAGVGMGLWDRNVSKENGITYSMIKDDQGQAVKNDAAWKYFYNAKITVDPATGKKSGGWANHKLGIKLEAFIEGAANFLKAVGLPIEIAISLLATLVACFAATTIDTATRLQRYVIQEIGAAVKVKPLTNKYIATGIAVITGLSLAIFIGEKPGSGGMQLWPVFGACNQILAGLGFLVIFLYLVRHNKPTWFIIIPAILMLVLPAWAMTWNMFNAETGWLHKGNYLLMALGGASIFLTAWLILEAAIAWKKAKNKLIDI